MTSSLWDKTPPSVFQLSPFKLAIAISTALAASPGVASNRPNAPLSPDNAVVTTDQSLRETVTQGVTTPNGSLVTRASHDVAVDASGNHVVVWERSVTDVATGRPAAFRINAQCFDASGAPRTAAFSVDLGGTKSVLRAPAVAMSATGAFTVVWAQNDDGTTSIRRRSYNAACQALESEITISRDTRAQTKSAPDIAMDADGDHVVTWVACGEVCGVQMRRFTRKLVAFDAREVVVNQSPVPPQSEARVAMSAAGDLTVVWTGDAIADSSGDVFARRYRRQGVARGDEFRVNDQTARAQFAPAVAMDASGDFVVAWLGYADTFGSQGRRVFGSTFFRRFRANGKPSGLDTRAFQPEEQPSGDFARSHAPAVAMDADGDFVVAAHAFLRSEAAVRGVQAQRFDVRGRTVGPSLRVNAAAASADADDSVYSALALDADGELLVAFSTRDPLLGLDRASGVFLRRYTGGENVDLMLAVAGPAGPLPVNTLLDYRLTVSNLHVPATTTRVAEVDAGIGLANGISIEGRLAPGLVFQSATGAGWACTRGAARQLTCVYTGVIAPTATTSVDVLLRASRSGSPTTSLGLVSAQFDAEAANNTGSVTTEVSP